MDEPSVYRRCPACRREELHWDFPVDTRDDETQECEFCIAQEYAVHGVEAYQARKAAGMPRPGNCPRE